MAEIDVLKAQIVRENSQSPWGFRLKGGAELGQSLSVARVSTNRRSHHNYRGCFYSLSTESLKCMLVCT